jgi:hypothetical protein
LIVIFGSIVFGMFCIYITIENIDRYVITKCRITVEKL